MEWHIITSSKGGVGKTILSLMLLTYYLKDNNTRSTFAIDLNGMNSDFQKLISAGGEKQNLETLIEAGCGEKRFDLVCYKVDFCDMKYILAWPQDPFKMLCGADEFFNFLCKIKDSVPAIAKKFQLQPGTVIVDTNFHFCNVFSDDSEVYGRFDIFQNQDEQFFVWFIWVFRQLDNLLNLLSLERGFILEDGNGNVADERLRQIAETMQSCVNDQCINPFVHVFNTTTVIRASRAANLFQQIFPRDSEVPELRNLRDQPAGQMIDFQGLLENFEKLKPDKKDVYVQDIHDNRVFLDLLGKYADEYKSCPRNVVPITHHLKVLESYTEGTYSRSDELINWFYKESVYKNFETSFKRLLDAHRSVVNN
ncbi:MAG: hypothetical protein DRR19_10505 [Candidatus Parabeggiatoa sp. nov. 1]|nr:MAG: hypothetical protein DRR19_10505 [Gammaproteobacteria bacterium]